MPEFSSLICLKSENSYHPVLYPANFFARILFIGALYLFERLSKIYYQVNIVPPATPLITFLPTIILMYLSCLVILSGTPRSCSYVGLHPVIGCSCLSRTIVGFVLVCKLCLLLFRYYATSCLTALGRQSFASGCHLQSPLSSPFLLFVSV